jgi:hypothetical protein
VQPRWQWSGCLPPHLPTAKGDRGEVPLSLFPLSPWLRLGLRTGTGSHGGLGLFLGQVALPHNDHLRGTHDQPCCDWLAKGTQAGEERQGFWERTGRSREGGLAWALDLRLVFLADRQGLGQSLLARDRLGSFGGQGFRLLLFLGFETMLLPVSEGVEGVR